MKQRVKYILSVILLIFLNGDAFSQNPVEYNAERVMIDSIVKSRIELQELFDLSGDRDFAKIYYQTLNLEAHLADYFYSKKEDSKETYTNPQVTLARMVYIEARTWCMTEPLKKRTDFLFSSKKISASNRNNNLLKLSKITNLVDSGIDNAKRFDRLKYRNNSSVVIANWEHTVGKLKDLSEIAYSLDKEYKNYYRTMLSDMYSMIGILDMY